MSIAIALALAVAGSTGGTDISDGLKRCVADQVKATPINGIIAGTDAGKGWHYVSGAADANGRPITLDTPFRLASVGKLFTRVAVGQLIDAGKLKIDASVRTYLPELPASFEPVTLAMLLEHRSGATSMTMMTPADGPVLANAKTARDVVPMIGARPLEFTPGSDTRYSNGGYFLLGAVIEAVSGLSYRDYVQQNIFGPLKMANSSFDPTPLAAIPMTRLSGPGQPPLATPQPRREMAAFKASPAGDTLSSASDMGKLAEALIGDRLLSAAAKSAVFPRKPGTWRMGQAGGSIGSNTDFWVLPDEKRWLVVLTNRDPPAGEIMGKVLGAVLSGKPCQTLTPADVPSPFGAPPPGTGTTRH